MTKLHILDPNPGAKTAVLKLHGLGATGASWSLQFPALLKEGYRPLAPDAPGFGRSPYDGRGWRMQKIAGMIAEAMDELRTGPVHVVGLSMGGVIAQQFAHDYPERVKKLVLASTFTVMRPDNLSEWFYFLHRVTALALRGLPAQAKVVAQRVFPKPEQAVLREMLEATIAGADKKAYQGAMRALGFFDSRKWLPAIKQPTLVVSGAEDSTVSVGAQAKLARGIPGAKHVIIENAGHAVNVDQADKFNQILLDFLH